MLWSVDVSVRGTVASHSSQAINASTQLTTRVREHVTSQCVHGELREMGFFRGLERNKKPSKEELWQ